MKAGDKVYRARATSDGIEVGEATVKRAGPERVTLDAYSAAWRYRAQVKPSECHLTREAALTELLEQTKKNARDYRESAEAEEARAKEIEAMLRTPTESSSP